MRKHLFNRHKVDIDSIVLKPVSLTDLTNSDSEIVIQQLTDGYDNQIKEIDDEATYTTDEIEDVEEEDDSNFRSESMTSVKKRRYSQFQESSVTDDEMFDISPSSTSVR